MTSLAERTWYRVIACMLAMLVAIGLVRYSFSPLIPTMLDHHWLTAAQAGYLGTVNFLGNILGAVVCATLTRRFTGGGVCRAALAIGLVSVGLSAIDFGPWWLAGCRFLAGLTAAGVMILAPALVTQGVDPRNRGKLMGSTFVGAGLGVIILSLTLPLVPGHGPTVGWLYTAALTLVCVVIAWPGLKTRESILQNPPADDQSRAYRGRLILLAISYFFAAAAIVPTSIYLAAYIHDQLKEATSFSVMVYAIYGVGIMLGGPLLDAVIRKWVGRYFALVIAMAIGLVGTLLLVLSGNTWMAVASGLVVGIAQMGYASLTTHRTLALAGPAGHIRWWGRLTIVFNVGMALAAFAMGYMIHLDMGYEAGFWMGAGSFALATIFALITTEPSDLKGRE